MQSRNKSISCSMCTWKRYQYSKQVSEEFIYISVNHSTLQCVTMTHTEETCSQSHVRNRRTFTIREIRIGTHVLNTEHVKLCSASSSFVDSFLVKIFYTRESDRNLSLNLVYHQNMCRCAQNGLSLTENWFSLNHVDVNVLCKYTVLI